MQKIFNFFPLTVYKSSILLSEKEKEEMISEIRLMEKKSKNIDYKSSSKAWTGDTQGFEYLHNNPKFENLFIQINKCIIEYLENLSINHKKLDLYFQRSWATISKNKEHIDNHSHDQSHISIAYYLSKKKDDSKIMFFDSNKQNEFIPQLFDSRSLAKGNLFNKRDILNSSKVVFDTKEDEVLVFPSKTIHGTEQGKSNSERISISADVVFVAKDSSTLEHLVPPIKNWKQFSN